MTQEVQPDKPILAFQVPDMEAVQRILARAEAAAEKSVRLSRPAPAPTRSLLTQNLERSMASLGRTAKHRPSIRMTATDTGGRTFHFALTVITKGKRGSKGSTGATVVPDGPAAAIGGSVPDIAGKTTEKFGRAGRPIPITREGGHQAYLERNHAVGRDRMPVGEQSAFGITEGILRDAPARAIHDAAAARKWVEAGRGEEPGLSEVASEVAAQAYVENVGKVAFVDGTMSSFGTIGQTLQERIAFWDIVHEHESAAGGRTQSRLVLELPHEASPQARHEIVRRYTAAEFGRKNIPYWAAIHEPTKRNNSRNYHAHVVFTERPMRMMTHPDTGEQVWDFTVEVRVRNATRHTRTTHPFRQNRDPETREKNWVKKSRARFALIVNEVMTENKIDVRYDPRSYKDMGLNVVPMASISRILADKSKTQPFLVMDADWTRRMIETEMREAALRRDKTFRQLQHVEEQIEKALRWKRFPRRANALLPPAMRLHPGHIMGSNMGGRISGKLLNLEAVRLATQFLDEATERTLKYVVEATIEIPPSRARANTRPGLDEPDPSALAILHAAAVEELFAFELSRSSRVRGLRQAGNILMESWRLEARTDRKAWAPSSPNVCLTDKEVQTAALRSGRDGRIPGNMQAMPRKRV